MLPQGVIAALCIILLGRLARKEWLDYKHSWVHCGIRVSPAYVRAMQRLRDPADRTPFRLYVLRPWNPRTWQLWRMAVRIERKVFWEEDNNTAFQLWRAAALYLLTTRLVVGVDQRCCHVTYPMPYGMMRNTWGSVFGLVTPKAMKDKHYWHVRPLRKMLRDHGMHWLVAFSRHTLDITMIAVLREYRGITDYTDHIPATLGLLAQTCQVAEDTRTRDWFTILAKAPYHIIQRQTGEPWLDFGLPWMAYFGSKGSKPLYCDFRKWTHRLFTQQPELFSKFFRDGMAVWFRYMPRSAPLRDPVAAGV